MIATSWKTALSGDVRAIATAICARPFDADAPDELQIDYKPAAIRADWAARLVAAKQGVARWRSGRAIAYRRETIVEVDVVDVPATAKGALDWLADLPFEIASFPTVHASWASGPEPYRAVGFADGHWPHGWACAFRGAGHDRLVSRRWLEHGPWALARGDRGTSLILFHDPEADAATALAQARPGHARMGIAPDGGFLQSDFVHKYDLRGRYLPATREQRIVASRRDVEPREMLEACAARRHRRWGAETPVDRVTYVFLEEDRARRHLHDLWLRELGCIAVIDGEDQALDLTYRPTPTPPEWASAALAR